jgi:hypothetical protein
VLEQGVDRDHLAGLDVDADANREARVLVETVGLRRHVGQSRLRRVRRVALLFVLTFVALAAAGCGGNTTYTLPKTRKCLETRGVQVGKSLDFVASTATGGAFSATLGDNAVKIVFGQTESDAQQIMAAYQRFAFTNVQAGLSDVLRRYNNAVTLWHAHPQDADLSLIVGCLR